MSLARPCNFCFALFIFLQGHPSCVALSSSQPYSRFHPHYSKAALEARLKREGLRYVFMGDTLGGRPQDTTCYVNGKVDYTILRAKPFYQQGIQRLRNAWEKQTLMVLMCSEQKPHECHRSKLIGNTLSE